MFSLLPPLFAPLASPRPLRTTWEPPDSAEEMLHQLELKLAPHDDGMPPQTALMPQPRDDANVQLDRGPCKSPEAIADERTDAWSRFYVVRDVCIKGRQRCGSQPRNGFEREEQAFNPLSVLEKWADIYELSCPGKPSDARREAKGLAFVVQHVDTFFPFNIAHQADSLLSLYSDMTSSSHMTERLANASSVLLPQFLSDESLHAWPWLVDMLKVVLPNATTGERVMRTCEDLAARPPICFDELIVHRQMGPWVNKDGGDRRKLHKINPELLPSPSPGPFDDVRDDAAEVSRMYFPSESTAKSFRQRAKEVLQLPTCPDVGKSLTLTLVVRRDARGYKNWDEIINQTAELVAQHKPWTFSYWEPKSESLATQAARFACTDLLVSVHGAHAMNMIFMPPTAGVIYAARCGCSQTSGYMKQLAAQTGLRWWDELEDCAPSDTRTCVTISEVGESSNHTADFEKNWQEPIAQALNYMRVSAASRRAVWRAKPEIILPDPRAVVAAREVREEAGPPASGSATRIGNEEVSAREVSVPKCVSLDPRATDEWCTQTCTTSLCPTELCRCTGSWLSRTEPVDRRTTHETATSLA